MCHCMRAGCTERHPALWWGVGRGCQPKGPLSAGAAGATHLAVVRAGLQPRRVLVVGLRAMAAGSRRSCHP